MTMDMLNVPENVGGVRENLTFTEKVEESKKILRLASDMSKAYYGKPIVIAYSGGKDSQVLLDLAEKCLTADEFEVLNGHTTVDCPETVYFIRKEFKRLEEKGIKTTIDYHRDENGNPITMWNLIPEKLMPPTRIIRYCCAVLKESGTPNRICALGVRAAESSKRQGRDVFGIRGGNYRQATFFSLDHTEEVHREAQELNDPVWDCTLIKLMKEHGSTVVNPLYYWEDSDIWDYIKQEKLEVNPLYERGYERVGCIGCPLAPYRQRVKEFQDYPKYKQMYINAFNKMLENRKARGKKDVWKDGHDVMDWWLEVGKHEVKGQYNLFDEDIYG